MGRVGELATRFTFQEQQVNIAIIIRHGRLLAMEESLVAANSQIHIPHSGVRRKQIAA